MESDLAKGLDECHPRRQRSLSPPPAPRPFDIFLLRPQYFPIACIYMSLASVAREVTAGTDDGAELPLMADGRSGGVATCDSGRSVINEASGDTFTQGGRTAK